MSPDDEAARQAIWYSQDRCKTCGGRGGVGTERGTEPDLWCPCPDCHRSDSDGA